jgi:Zn-dependent peptidase ImmA (M78 family)
MRKQNKIFTKNTKAQIALCAEMVLEMYPPHQNKTDVRAILRAEGICLLEETFEDHFEGLIHCKNDKFYIYLNKRLCESMPAGRINFTIAHELGHYFLPWHKKSLVENELMQQKQDSFVQEDELIEREAEYFASCLLMPEKEITAAFSEAPFSLSLIDAVAEQFGVSRYACIVRYVEKGPDPIMLVYSNSGRVTSTYPKKSANFPEAKLYVDLDDFLPECCLASSKNYAQQPKDYVFKMHPTAEVFVSHLPIDLSAFTGEICLGLPEAGSFLSVFYFQEEGRKVEGLKVEGREVEV